ncbi:hypothetical protein KR038_000295 [Drosophila bunnanda]|nr:hypothetical protein KR038_000295 [Drosophila bunnanda]
MFGYASIIVFFLALPALHGARLLHNSQNIGSRVFYVEKNATLDWFEAARTCRRMNGQLATIRSQEELNLIVPHLDWDSKYWLALNDLAQEGTFQTLSPGQPAPFLNWRQGQPDNYNFNEHCVLNINYYMYDSACTEKARFICEK